MPNYFPNKMNSLDTDGRDFSPSPPQMKPQAVGRPLNQHPRLSNTPFRGVIGSKQPKK